MTNNSGRPLTDDLIGVAIPERNLKAFWDPQRQRFVGDPEITRFASLYAVTGQRYEGTPERKRAVVCGTGSDEAIMASLLAACGGRGVVLGDRAASR